jgi:hypothetical protein
MNALRAMLDQALSAPLPHVERLTLAVVAISEALRQRGMQATLVGGGAIEFHASEVYTTSDIDLVVEGGLREEIDAALAPLGFARRGRHWIRGDLFVEVPGNWMSDPVETIPVGDLALRVVRREVVLADRIIGFKHWRATGYGAQAIALLALFGGSLDGAMLRDRLRGEEAEDALDALQEIARSGAEVTEARLQEVLATLHQRRQP